MRVSCVVVAQMSAAASVFGCGDWVKEGAQSVYFGKIYAVKQILGDACYLYYRPTTGTLHNMHPNFAVKMDSKESEKWESDIAFHKQMAAVLANRERPAHERFIPYKDKETAAVDAKADGMLSSVTVESEDAKDTEWKDGIVGYQARHRQADCYFSRAVCDETANTAAFDGVLLSGWDVDSDGYKYIAPHGRVRPGATASLTFDAKTAPNAVWFCSYGYAQALTVTVRTDEGGVFRRDISVPIRCSFFVRVPTGRRVSKVYVENTHSKTPASFAQLKLYE